MGSSRDGHKCGWVENREDHVYVRWPDCLGMGRRFVGVRYEVDGSGDGGVLVRFLEHSKRVVRRKLEIEELDETIAWRASWLK